MPKTEQELICTHCGAACNNHKLDVGAHSFCCKGCRSVYLLLSSHGMDQYYCLNERPGTVVKEVPATKFNFLDEPEIAARLLSFNNGEQAQVTLYLPHMHCSSCVWLLEHLDRLNPAIAASRVSFATKEISVSFNIKACSLRQLAELLTMAGYEPCISLQDSGEQKAEAAKASRRSVYRLGISGFCFANIMLISFPEYLGLDAGQDVWLSQYFRFVNLLLALPVLFFGGSVFFAMPGTVSISGISILMRRLPWPSWSLLPAAYMRSLPVPVRATWTV